MRDLARGVISGDQCAERDRERIDEAVGDPTVGIGVSNGQAGPFLYVLVQEVNGLICRGSWNFTRLMGARTFSGAKRTNRGANERFARGGEL